MENQTDHDEELAALARDNPLWDPPAQEGHPVTARGNDDLHDSADSEEQAISNVYPGWESWGGVLAGLLYAKRRDPQIVVRSTSIEGLRAEIEAAERRRGLR